ncbi:cell division protein FtsA [Streptococcus pneumoniae]|nr:cell division protein FtsA [Streptococcus pneumoniae]
MTPDREVITFIPEEFIVDGFQGIRDPRGMMGVRLEMRGLLYTGPRTILHNLRKTVERAGVQVENVIISPLAMVQSVLNEGEREFGATVIDILSQISGRLKTELRGSLSASCKQRNLPSRGYWRSRSSRSDGSLLVRNYFCTNQAHP